MFAQNAKRYFGTWREAVRAAGCEPARRRWSKEVVIKEIRERCRRNLPLSSILFKQDGPLAGAATRLFGSWRAALDAAGIPGTRLSQNKAISHR